MNFEGGSEVFVKNIKYKHLLILFHGYGSNGVDIMPFAYEVKHDLENTALLAPNGFEPVFGIEGGYKWFDIDMLTPEDIYTNMITVKSKLIKYIEEQLERFNLGYEDLILGGFSQGACIALYLNFILNKKVNAVLSLSGGLPFAEKIIKESKDFCKNVCIIHGKEDTVIPYMYSSETHRVFKEHGLDSQLHLINGMEHTIGIECVKIARDFLNKTIED